MRKHLSLLLAAVLLFTMLPFNVLASENTSEREELLALACEAFPEYADKIMHNPPIPTSATRSATQNNTVTLVTTETRNLSDSTRLTYTEYSDGLIFLTETEDKYYKEVTTESYSSSAYAVHATISIKGTSNVNQSYFILDNVSYSLYNGSYDEFTNTGTMSTTPYVTVCQYYPSIRAKETASDSALIAYRFNWLNPNDPSDFRNSLLTITIQNNNVTISHVDNT